MSKSRGTESSLDPFERIEKKLDQLNGNYELLCQSMRALQKELANAIPVMQKLDHVERIKEEQRQLEEELRRELIEKSA